MSTLPYKNAILIQNVGRVKESIINAYEIKTTLSHAQLSHMMDDETWINAKKAIELGFADALLTDETRTTESEAYAFSGKTIENTLLNKISAKAQSEITPVPKGRSVDELKAQLNAINNYI